MREAQRIQRELRRQAKEQAKLTAIEQARLEVEAAENALDVLLSVHKEEPNSLDWQATAATLPPPGPVRLSHHELRAKQDMVVLPAPLQKGWEERVEQARLQDDLAFQAAMQSYATEVADSDKLRSLARRVLVGDVAAYIEAIDLLSPLAEMKTLGSSLIFTSHGARLLECLLTLNGTEAIPAQAKSLTATGKVSVKAIARSRFHELYQDYVCSCMLRVAREVFALLPVDTLIETAFASVLDTSSGRTHSQPVLSAVVRRRDLAGLDFDHLDPSDTIEKLLHRGDFKASRKTGAFQAITPLTSTDVPESVDEGGELQHLMASAEAVRRELSVAMSGAKSEL